MKKIAIVGGGPSGIFCAIKILELSNNFEITIFEKGRVLSTLIPTGNGRCNLAFGEYNHKELSSFYPRGEKFLYSIFSRYGLYETLNDFEKFGVETYFQEDNRIFPKTNSSVEVAKALYNKIKGKVKIEHVEVKEPLKGYDAVILACGLKFGANLIEKYGHKITPLKPALTGLCIKEKEFLKLEGVSFNGVIFTNKGVSGPFIYKLSSINAYKSFPYEIKIPLINVENLKSEVKNNPKKLFKNIVSNFLPRSLAEILIKSEKQCANTTNKEIEALEFLTLTATNTDGKGEIVHAGGADLKEINKNLKSKIQNNLWIIGEALDIDGFTGGFNLQLCWSTASIAALDIVSNFAP